MTYTVLHLAHTIAMRSSVLRASTSCLVLIPWSMSRCSPPFIGFIGFVSSAALTVFGSQAASAIAIATAAPVRFFLFTVFTFCLSFCSCCACCSSEQTIRSPEICYSRRMSLVLQSSVLVLRFIFSQRLANDLNQPGRPVLFGDEAGGTGRAGQSFVL